MAQPATRKIQRLPKQGRQKRQVQERNIHCTFLSSKRNRRRQGPFHDDRRQLSSWCLFTLQAWRASNRGLWLGNQSEHSSQGSICCRKGTWIQRIRPALFRRICTLPRRCSKILAAYRKGFGGCNCP